MFKNIIVPVDLTPKNKRAVAAASDLAAQTGGQVVLLHVIETLDLPFEDLREFYDRLQAKAIAHMEGLASGIERAEVPFEVHVLYGRRVEKILEFIGEAAADLVVMDSHVVDRGGPGRGPTTTSYLVAVAADCPVLLIKGHSAADDG